MRHYLMTMGLLLSAMTASAEYSGSVFIDANRNGVFDKGERGLQGVSVSDGKSVVKTDRNGHYVLPGHEKERFIFITTPSGYKTDNAYYRRIRQGENRYDFGVTPYNAHIAKDGRHRFIHVSDTEIGEAAEHDDWVEGLRQYATHEGAAFIIHTGDICYIPGLDNHIKIMNSATMNTQVFYCIGNHDLVKGAYGEEKFEQLYGPVYYSFDAGSVHYIVTPMPGGDHAPSYKQADVYEWMKNDLAQIPEGKPIMVFNHDLLHYEEPFRFYKNKDEFIDLDAYNLKAWLYGHWHINHIRKHKNAYSICTASPIRGGIDHAASAFRVLHVDGKGDFTSELRYSYLDKRIEIASMDNLQAAVTPEGRIPLSVNAYSTGSRTVAVNCSFRVDGKEIVRTCPLKQNTDFNWSAEVRLPDEAEGRLVTVTAEARYTNGEVARREHSFIYTTKPAPAIRLEGKSWTNLLGNAAHVGVAATAVDSLRLKWTANVGANIYMASPVVEDGRLFIATADDNDTGKAFVAAFDAATGKELWRTPVKGSIKNSIALAGGNVFAQDIYGNLYALRQDNGKVAWQKEMDVARYLPSLIEGLSARGDTVYAGSGRGLCAYDAVTGDVLWQNKGWSQNQGSTATLSASADVIVGDAYWGAVSANDVKTGKHLWTSQHNDLRFCSASPAMVDGLMYVAAGKTFFVIEAKTGRVIVQKPMGQNVDVASTPLVTDKEIIFGTATNGLLALDKETYEKKWEFRTRPAMIYTSPYVRNPACTVETSPVLSGDIVYFGASDGTLYGVDKEKGKLVWKHATGAPIFGSVSVVGNALFAVDFGGNVYGFVAGKQ